MVPQAIFPLFIYTVYMHMRKILYFTTLFSGGFAVLVIEILGARLITPYFGNTIFVWSALITITLTALSIGYYIGGRIGDTAHNPTHIFYRSIYIAGMCTVLIPLIALILLDSISLFGHITGPLITSALIFLFPISALSSATTIAVRLHHEIHKRIATSAGTVFAWSNAGSIIGALASGFLIIPLMRIDVAIYFMGLLLMILGFSGSHIRLRTIFTGILIIIVGGIPFLDTTKPIGELFAKDGLYGTVSVRTHPELGTCLLVDNVTQGCDTGNIETNHGVFHKLTEPAKDISSGSHVLFLGLGAGIGPKYVTRSDIYKTIIEIDPLVQQMSEQFFGVTNTENQKIITGDARSFLRNTNDIYDVIIVDLYKGSGTDASVWSREMFQLLSDRLTPTGLITLNIPGIASPMDKHVASALTTIETVFHFVQIDAEHPSEVSNIVIYASQNAGVQKYGDIVPAHFGHILTDRKNPIDTLYAPTGSIVAKNARLLFHTQ